MAAEIFIWLFLVELISLVSLPIALHFMGNMKDKGYAASKVLGILSLSYFTWTLSHISFRFITIFFSFTLFLLISLHYSKKVNVKKFSRENKDYIKKTEILFVAMFLFFVIVRMHFPAVEGLEKFSDFSIINGILRSEFMPPLDSWLSGHTLNYYYFGHFMVALLAKLSFIKSSIAFNLGLAMIFAMVGITSFSAGYNITGKFRYGLLAAFIITFMSNGFGFLQLITFASPASTQIFSNTLDLNYPLTCCSNPSASFTDKLKAFPVWSSTRIIPNTINEFPYSDFLFGELHPHALSIPFQILFILLMMNMLFSKNRYDITSKMPYMILVSLVLGSLFFINSWDYPAYTGLFFLVFFIKYIKGKKTILEKAKSSAPFFISVTISILLYISFFISEKRELVHGFVSETTSISHFLIIFPLFIFSAFYMLYKRSSKRDFFGIVILSVFISLVTGIQTLTILIPMIYFSLKNIGIKPPEENFAMILVFLGSVIAMHTDILFIDSRYNNVFKFFYHTWIFWGIASVYIIHKFSGSKIFICSIAVLLIVSSPMTVFATYDRLSSSEFSLDGWNYMKNQHPDDYEAIKWIDENIGPKNNIIILEAPGDAFQYSSIISTNTGVPTVIGWSNHEFVRRGILFNERIEDVNKIYSTNDLQIALNLIKKYNVKYVYIGSKEMEKYPQEGLEKFKRLKIIYNKNSIMVIEI